MILVGLTIAFDKTGTLTIGNPRVADQEIYVENIDEVLGYLASVEEIRPSFS